MECGRIGRKVLISHNINYFFKSISSNRSMLNFIGCGVIFMAMPNVLFVGDERRELPAFAALCAARSWGERGVADAAVKSGAEEWDDSFLEALRKLDLPLPPSPPSLERVNLLAFDLIIYFCSGDTPLFSGLPGIPPVVRWDVELLFPELASGKGFDAEVLDKVREMVKEVVSHGYLDAFLHARGQAESVLEHIDEGIIAHDVFRKIVYFNRAAEEITGYSREEVLGRDCHAVFPGKFCGQHCHFCDGSPGGFEGEVRYHLVFGTKAGEEKRLEVSVLPMRDEARRLMGVVASFRDYTREHDALERWRAGEGLHGIVGRHPKMRELFQTIQDLASSDVPVLIQGESGTGKELVASAIHALGPRNKGLFVPVNCGAIPEPLLESELFGHVKGAFTGALRDKKGRFELAHGGTLFLDEVGDIPPAMQVKLLRVLQDGMIYRLGDEKPRKVDVRVVAATNKDIEEEIRQGRFREDLYYRLCVVPVVIPPLRERKSDIPLLVYHFIAQEAREAGKEEKAVSNAALQALIAYHWPGNVRELRNAIQYAMLRCKSGLIDLQHLPSHIMGRPQRRGRKVSAPGRPKARLSVAEVLKALNETGNHRSDAARLLGVSRATLYRFMKEHNLA